MEICARCGLPKEACICEDLAKEEQRIKISTEKKRYGKMMTIISGISDVDLKRIAKKLKQELACGGTVKEGRIELQGEHKGKAKEKLIEMGFNQETIEEI